MVEVVFGPGQDRKASGVVRDVFGPDQDRKASGVLRSARRLCVMCEVRATTGLNWSGS